MADIPEYAKAFIRAQPWHWDTFFRSGDGVVFKNLEAGRDFNQYLAHEGYFTREQFEENIALEQLLRETLESQR